MIVDEKDATRRPQLLEQLPVLVPHGSNPRPVRVVISVRPAP
jgi:hypothetical protein